MRNYERTTPIGTPVALLGPWAGAVECELVTLRGGTWHDISQPAASGDNLTQRSKADCAVRKRPQLGGDRAREGLERFVAGAVEPEGRACGD
jgi:hypothetical protein